MRLLDDVRLIESEVLTPPTSSTFEHSMTKLASYEHSDSWTKLCNSSWEYNRSHRWKKTVADFFGARFGQESEPVSVEHRRVE